MSLKFIVTLGPDADTWYHVAVTRKDGVFNFYLDGVEVGENFNYQDISIPNVDAKVYFGSLAGASNLDGQIDEFRFWNVARTVSQIGTFRTESILERTSGLIGEYRFDGSLEDSSLSYNDGTQNTGSASYVTDATSITAPANKHKLRLRLNSNEINLG